MNAYNYTNTLLGYHFIDFLLKRNFHLRDIEPLSGGACERPKFQ